MNLKQQLILCDKALSNNNFIEAKTLLEEIIKIYPNIFELNFKLALVNNFLGNIEESINYYKKSIVINPNFSPSYCNLGIIYDKLNDRSLAIKNYLIAIKVDPKNFTYCSCSIINISINTHEIH